MYNKNEHFTDIKISGSKYKNYYGNFYSVLDGKTYSSMRGLINTFRKFSLTSEEFYIKYYKTSDEGMCKNDPNFETKFLNIVDGYKQYCGACSTCKQKIRETQSKAAKDPNVIKAKVEKGNAWREANLELLKEKAKRNTILLKEKYGQDYFSNKAKKQWESKSLEERQEIAKKVTETKIKNGTLSNSPAFGFKKITINGVEYSYQGYEDLILKMLNKFGLEFVVGKDVPKLRTNTLKSGFARPDIFVKSLNMIIEVKSEYTFYAGFEKLKDIHYNAVKDKKYSYFVFSVNVDKERTLKEKDTSQIEEFLDMAISSQAQNLLEKVQRLSHKWEYRPIVIGSGSARVPEDKFVSFYQFRNMI